MSKEFKIASVSSSFHEILSKIQINFEDVTLAKSISEIEEMSEESQLKVCFIGQYSAGKSTIISSLTGDKSIKIDSDIATDKTTDYSWNDLLLTDTPGLFTDRKDHDQITLSKIREADLLVFCLTNDLFDNIILENFNKLAFTDQLCNKMMLIVNKMNDESGEYDELVSNYRSTLNKSLGGNNLEIFPISFISSELYIDGLDENDNELVEYSHFNDFVENLNTFVTQKGLYGKIDKPIRNLISGIDETIFECSNQNDKELFQVIKRIEKAVVKSEGAVTSKVSQKIHKLTSTIINHSNILTSKVGDPNLQIDSASKEINKKIESEVEIARDEIQDIIDSSIIDLDEEIESVLESDLCQYVMDSIDNDNIKLNDTAKTDFSKVLQNFNRTKAGTSTVSKAIGGLTNSLGSGFAKASQVAGSQGHKIVLEVGKFFGTKFKPWQAVNLAKNVANAAKFLGPIMSVVGVVLEVADAVKEEKYAKQIATAKQDCHSQFLEISNAVESSFADNLHQFKSEYFKNIKDQIICLRTNYIEDKEFNDSKVNTLKEYKGQLINLISELYGENIKSEPIRVN